MTYLIYPTLDLYTYDLRDGLGQDPGKEIAANKKHFAKKLPTTITYSILENDSQFEAEYVELLGENKTEDILQYTPHPDFEGYYYPVRLSDTYGLLLDCSLKYETFRYPVECLEILKDTIDEQLKKEVATLGQTWMIFSELPADEKFYPAQPIEDVAQKCYQALIPGADWKSNLQGTGDFLGGAIFELWRYRLNISEGASTNTLPESCIKDNHHVIIILYPDKASLDKSADFIEDWMHLFCYRHKIMYAYNQSRLLKHTLKNDFIEIQKYVQQFHSKSHFSKYSLEKIQKNLEEAQDLFSRYGINLTYLNYQASTIEVNLQNYGSRLVKMQEKLETEKMPADLKLLEKFRRSAQEKYLGQVQKDSENLTAGLKLLETAVNLIRIEVEVERSTRDRNFQEVVGIYGVAFAAGSMVAGISSQFTTPPSQKSIEMARELPGSDFLSKPGITDKWLPLRISVIYSLTVWLFFVLLFMVIIIPCWQWLNRRR